MQCPNCHETLVDSARFCNKCGCKIEQDPDTPTGESSFPAAADEAPSAGQTEPAAKAQSAAPKAKSRKTKAVIAVCSLLVLAALALLWFYVIRPGGAPKAISAYPSTLTLQVGSQQKISCILTPENASSQDLIWTSSNTAVASVFDGTVVGLAPGTCTVTVASKKTANLFSQIAVEVTAGAEAGAAEASAAEASAAPSAASRPDTVQTASTDDMIKQIKSWYYSFQNNSSVVQSRIDEYTTISTLDNEIGEITCWPIPQDSGNPNAYIAFHYYHDGVPYFTLLQDPSKNLIRLYYGNGGIIAWIEPDGVKHYGSNADYAVWYDRAADIFSQY